MNMREKNTKSEEETMFNEKMIEIATSQTTGVFFLAKVFAMPWILLVFIEYHSITLLGLDGKENIYRSI